MSQHRRSRMRRTRTGKRIELTARDIEIFKLLARYRYLRSTYIHAFVGGASETRFKERLGDLFHEGYLDRPAQQWEFVDARHRPVVHEIGRGGMETLRAGGFCVEGGECRARNGQRQFLHTLMACEGVASLELEARSRGTLRFVPWSEILARVPKVPQPLTASLRLPVPSGGFLVPDGVFGIEYRTGEAKAYRFFALEVDRGTMPVARSWPGQTSYLAKLSAYREIIEARTHKSHWGIPNLLVLTLTTGEARLAEMLRRTSEIGTSPAFLFKSVSEGDLLRPLPRLFAESWQRVEARPLSIADSY